MTPTTNQSIIKILLATIIHTYKLFNLLFNKIHLKLMMCIEKLAL